MDLNNSPDFVKSFALKEFSRWQNRIKDMEEAKRESLEITGYSLKMFWQDRKDKLSHYDLPAYQWINENLLDFKYEHNLKNQFADQDQLSRQTISKLWDMYILTPG